MRKPHWELITQIHDHLRSVAKFVRIEGPAAGVGPISDAAVLRRIRFINFVTGKSFAECATMAGTFGYNGNEIVGDRCPLPGYNPEWVHATAFASYVMFVRGGEKIFKVGREFGEVLEVVDLDVKAKLIPELPTFICVEFPESIRFHDPSNGDYFHCAYVAVQKATAASDGKEAFKPVDRDGADLYCTMEILLPCFDADGKEKDEENNTTLCFRDPEDTISASIARAHRASSHPINCPAVFEYIIKFLIYLGSGDPDLREYRAPKPGTANAKKLKRWFRDHENRSLVDMTLVGFSWKKPHVYHVGETTVTGHPRWQPYGPNREKVKLIWIEPHVRHYGAKEEAK